MTLCCGRCSTRDYYGPYPSDFPPNQALDEFNGLMNTIYSSTQSINQVLKEHEGEVTDITHNLKRVEEVQEKALALIRLANNKIMEIESLLSTKLIRNVHNIFRLVYGSGVISLIVEKATSSSEESDDPKSVFLWADALLVLTPLIGDLLISYLRSQGDKNKGLDMWRQITSRSKIVASIKDVIEIIIRKEGYSVDPNGLHKKEQSPTDCESFACSVEKNKQVLREFKMDPQEVEKDFIRKNAFSNECSSESSSSSGRQPHQNWLRMIREVSQRRSSAEPLDVRLDIALEPSATREAPPIRRAESPGSPSTASSGLSIVVIAEEEGC